MSDKIFLSYKNQKKSASIPKNYSELKQIFFSLFNIDEKESELFSFKYTNSEGDDILIDEDQDKSFEETMSDIKKSDSNIYIEKLEDLEDPDEDNNTNNNEALRSGMIFKPNNQKDNEEYEKKIQILEKRNKELIEKNKNLIHQKEKLEKDKKDIIEKNKNLIYLKLNLQKEIQELQEKQTQYESNKDFNEINNKINEVNELKQKLEESQKKLEKYEKEINEYKSQIEQSKLDILNLQKNKETEKKELDKEKYVNEFLKKKYEEKTKEELNKINRLLQKKLQEKADKIKSVYEKKYKDTEEKIEQFSQAMISNMSNMSNMSLSNIDKSSYNYEHKGIKCERCFTEPIKGYRYKCSVCNNYNLCGKCEEENQKNFFHNHEHDFIKMRKTKNTNK